MSNNKKEYFNAQWYLEQYPEVAKAHLDPRVHFLKYGWKLGYKPGKDFDMKQYLTEHPEILQSDIPLVSHMQLICNNLSTTKLIYPQEAISLEQCFKSFEHGKKLKRVTIFASVLYGSLLHEHELYLLEKLREVSDVLIYIADSLVLPNEFQKLSSLVDYALCTQHNEYDFGSYKYGLQYLQEHIDLKDIEELVLCNNSCIAPVFPLKNLFETMNKRNVDFWGITSSHEICFHLQSYFLVFNNKVLQDEAFLSFFQNITQETSRGKVIFKYELNLTSYLQKYGFNCDAFVHGIAKEQALAEGIKAVNTTKYPCQLMLKDVPFIKTSFLTNSKINQDGVGNTLQAISKYNPELGLLARKYRSQFAMNKQKWLERSLQECELQKELTHQYLQFCEQLIAYQAN